MRQHRQTAASIMTRALAFETDELRPTKAWCTHDEVHVRLADGREVVTPLWWYPRLLAASPSSRNTIELMLDGVHWPDVDEDLSVRGMLSGWKYPNAVPPSVAAE